MENACSGWRGVRENIKVYIYVCVYIYVYGQTERERERENITVCVCRTRHERVVERAHKCCRSAYIAHLSVQAVSCLSSLTNVNEQKCLLWDKHTNSQAL
mmetsp:Transcript_29919/g.48209  ORF Transcript_29919/g.48209 Transcript_29919/m.48209 type:complete len:100 (+) Transcript_29919:459-758(+)